MPNAWPTTTKNYTQDNEAYVLMRPILIYVTDSVRNEKIYIWSSQATLSGFGPVCEKANISALRGRKGHFQTCAKTAQYDTIECM